MDEVDALRDLAERAAGRLVVTVVVAVALGWLLWPLGWSPAFHLGPWPWVLTAPAVVAVAGLEAWGRAMARQREDERETTWKAAVRAAGREAQAPALADFLVGSLETRRGAAASPAPEGPWKAEIDASPSPMLAAVRALAARAPDRGESLLIAWESLAPVEARAPTSHADALVSLWAWTLPFGLIGALGPWVVLVAPAVALTLFAVPMAGARPKSPFRP